jgi:hypothetical protein
MFLKVKFSCNIIRFCGRTGFEKSSGIRGNFKNYYYYYYYVLISLMCFLCFGNVSTGVIYLHEFYVPRVEIYVQRLSLACFCYFKGCRGEKLDWGGEGEHMYLKENIIRFRAFNVVIPTQKFKRYTKYTTVHRVFQNVSCNILY